MSTFSTALLLFLVLDPIGNVPLFIVALKNVDPDRHTQVIARESVIGLGFLVMFLLLGPWILRLLHISQSSLSIAGGIILFLIALKMIFTGAGDVFGITVQGEPLVVPLAVPLIAGPSAMATVMLLMARQPEYWPRWLAAIILAWIPSCCILLFAPALKRLLGERGLIAVERLMGMILATVSVQMLLDGIQNTFLPGGLAG